MGYFSCNWPDEHKREGREDFDRYGRYGYDSFKYDDPFNDCNQAYTDGFNEARREEERREERREEERQEERRYERQQAERREQRRQAEEDEYYRMYEQQEEPPEQEPPRYPSDGLPF